MNLLHLEYFKLVAETQNISKAANESYISSSGLSKVIARLENEVGYPLFERYSNKLILNEAGKIMYRFAESVLDQQKKCKEEIKMLMEEAERNVRVAIPADRLVSGIFNLFMKENPEIIFNQLVMSTLESEQAIMNHEIDFAISHKAPEEPGFVWKPLTETEMCLAVGKEHVLAVNDIHEIRLEELKNELFFIQASSSDERNVIISWCRQANFTPHIYQSNAEMTFQALSKGIGAAFVMDYFFGDEKQQSLTGQYMNGNDIAHKVNIISPQCIIPTGLIRREGQILSKSAQKLYQMICRYYCVEDDL